MRFNRKTQHVIETLLYLEENKNLGYILLKDISEFYNIPIEHERKVIRILKDFDYLESKQGSKGGIRLKVDADKVDFYKIFLITENIDVDMYRNCKVCSRTDSCRFKSFMNTKFLEFVESFKGVTLQDFMNEQTCID